MIHSVWTEILNVGISTITAPLPKSLWNSLYVDFDAFSDSVLEAPDAMDSFNNQAKDWQENSGLKMLYGGYFSPYFRNTSI